ncbi:MFS transporter [Iamia majanohamensis]|uniref:MFS transporter n=1 Tax=Iamia majanohamensis TaxID=467976 RepID=A0AAE9Y3I8_9ACTN|nr:MFS transporter [Iamia majanohamensis]WCO65145.1 MFS transporter [Iamia majanohamensis]
MTETAPEADPGRPPDRDRDATPAPPARPWSLLTDRTFGPFFLGSLVSNAGNWFQNLAAAVVIYAVTGSNTLVGVVSVLQFGATLVLSPWAGVAGDRFDRRRLLVAAQLVSFVGAAGLAVAVALVGVDGLGGPLPVFGATLVIGVGYAFSVPMIQAIVPQLVRREDLDSAIALSSVTFNLARAIGPALAGALIGAAGAAAAFGVNAASFLVLCLALLVVHPRPVEVEQSDDGDRSIRGGFRWARADPVAVPILLATLALGWASDPVNTLSPAVADGFGHTDAFVGALVSAFGAGAAATALVVERIRGRLGGLRATQLAFLLISAGLIGLAFSPHEVLGLAALALAGAGFLIGVTSLNGALQRRVPESLRGRVMALWSVALLGSRPFAALVDGSVADLTTTSTALCVAGAVPIVAALLLRRVRTPDTEGAPA